MFENRLDLTIGIVSAFVANNSIRPDDLLTLLADVHNQLVDLTGSPKVEASSEKPKAMMPWKKTIHDSHLISLEDGKPYKTLKRHLARLGMTPADYKEKWSLPKDYPLVAKDYAARRSELARSIGLGRKPTAEPETVLQPGSTTEEPKKGIVTTAVKKAFALQPKAKGREKKPEDADPGRQIDSEAQESGQDAA